VVRRVGQAGRKAATSDRDVQIDAGPFAPLAIELANIDRAGKDRLPVGVGIGARLRNFKWGSAGSFSVP
jgi:hypothetical protein